MLVKTHGVLVLLDCARLYRWILCCSRYAKDQMTVVIRRGVAIKILSWNGECDVNRVLVMVQVVVSECECGKSVKRTIVSTAG